jgi:hypothetical protein
MSASLAVRRDCPSIGRTFSPDHLAESLTGAVTKIANKQQAYLPMNTTTISDDKKKAYCKEALEKWMDSGLDADFWHTTDDGLYDINVFETKNTSDGKVVTFDSLSAFMSLSLYDLSVPAFDRKPIPMGVIWNDL